MSNKIIKQVRKFWDWKILFIEVPHATRKIQLKVQGKVFSDYPVIYDTFSVAYDCPEVIPQSIRTYLEKNAFKLRKELNKLNERYTSL